MSRTCTWFLALTGGALVLGGCSDIGLTSLTEKSPDVRPVIEVTPAALDFGMLPDGETAVRSFTVTNLGGQPLTVSDLELDAPESFTILTDLAGTLLDQGEAVVVDVAFTPLAEGEIGGVALVHSDDPTSPAVPVELLGWAAAPRLTIDPTPLDFGTTAMACETTADLHLTNTGLEILHIDALDYASTDGAMRISRADALPITLSPGAEAIVTVAFTPAGAATSTSTLAVTSNDPRGVQRADQSGRGEPGAPVADAFDKAIDPAVDLLFAVDQSGSMDGHSASLAAAFDAFIQQIDKVTTGWRIGVVTADTGCFNSGFIDAKTPGYQQVFADAVALGTVTPEYSLTEKLFALTDNALVQTEPGGCNARFLRPEALLHVVLMSDELEQSGVAWDSWLAGWQGYVDAPELLKVSSIVNVASTCGDLLGPGEYDDMALATGGLVLDVCTADWAAYTGDLAEVSLSAVDLFELSQVPDPTSMLVTVNGQEWAAGWHYDSHLNQVIFEQELPEGAHITVDYDSVGCL